MSETEIVIKSKNTRYFIKKKENKTAKTKFVIFWIVAYLKKNSFNV